MNVHCLTHIPHFVHLWQPVWIHSGYLFDGYNGSLLKMVHSTRKVAEQLSFALDAKQSLQNIYYYLESRESEKLLTFLQYTIHTRNMTKLKYSNTIRNMKTCDLDNVKYREIEKLCCCLLRQMRVLERFFYNDMTFS